MKQTVLVSAILIGAALTIGFITKISFTPHAGEVPMSTNSSVTRSGFVTDLDQSQSLFDGPVRITAVDARGEVFTVAVPTRGLTLCAAAENIVAVERIAREDNITVTGSLDEMGTIIPCAGADHSLTVFGNGGNAAFNFEFLYRKGPAGYTKIEDTENTHQDFVFGTILFDSVAYELFLKSTEAREGPPSMHIRVYENPTALPAADWATKNEVETNISRALSEPSVVRLGGVAAVEFLADGLYPTRTYVAAHDRYIYVLTGTYLDVQSKIYDDFLSVVESFTFLDPLPSVPALNGKINPAVVCENALMYLTFTDSVAAQNFVAACVRGEHPEVIEQYIRDQGLDGAVI